MPHPDFAYTPAIDLAAMPLAVSIFADRMNVREQLREDAAGAGLALRECGPVAALIEGEPRSLGDVVLLDCPSADAAMLAALARLDARAARAGANLVVSTSVAALEDVFACCDQSNPQILVDPTRADRVVALGRVLAKVPRLRVRDLSEDDRLALLRLTEQVSALASRLERIDANAGIIGDDRTFRVESPVPGYRGPQGTPPPLPDPRLVRRVIRQRHLRGRFFDAELFADPAWDILLDLTAARVENARVSVTSACIASGVPPTTALRWIGQLTEAGLLERVQDVADRRRAFIALSDSGAEAMARYFAEVGVAAAELV